MPRAAFTCSLSTELINDLHVFAKRFGCSASIVLNAMATVAYRNDPAEIAREIERLKVDRPSGRPSLMPGKALGAVEQGHVQGFDWVSEPEIRRALGNVTPKALREALARLVSTGELLHRHLYGYGNPEMLAIMERCPAAKGRLGMNVYQLKGQAPVTPSVPKEYAPIEQDDSSDPEE